MSTEGYRCGQCGGALAPADTLCASCGAPVAPAQRMELLGKRAETLAEDGQYAQASRTVSTLLALPLEPLEAKAWRRKRAVWLQRMKDPASLDAAEVDLREALRLDDRDDLGHQLWIDLLRRRGRLEEARAEYQRRLKEDPEDAVAHKQLAGLRLMEDLKAAPVPKLNLSRSGEGGIIINALRPTPYKMFMAGIALLFCVITLLSAGNARVAQASLAESQGGLGGLGPVMGLFTNPWINGAQMAAYGAYLFWGFKIRAWRKS